MYSSPLQLFAVSSSSTSRLLRNGLILFVLAIALLALSPTAQAVMPAPDGGYPNANTVEGDGALQSLTSGGANTAIGFQALFGNTTGSANTATGLNALFSSAPARTRISVPCCLEWCRAALCAGHGDGTILNTLPLEVI
jgi:hypothetical protein